MVASYFLGPADVYGGDYGLYKTLLPATTSAITSTLGSQQVEEAGKDDKGESKDRGEDQGCLDVAHDPSKTHSVGACVYYAYLAVASPCSILSYMYCI